MNTIDLKKDFFGRHNVLSLLSRRVTDLKEGYRQNIAILGNRFVGKTALLCKFLSTLEDDSIIDIYLDLDTKDTHYLFKKFAGSLLYNYSRHGKLPLHEDLNLLMQSTKSFIPQTVEAIKKIEVHIHKGRFTEGYRELLSLPDVFSAETGKFCVIILDEFHCLEELGVADVFLELGKKIMTQKKCLYIVTSSYPVVARKIIAEKLSLLFGNFEIIPLAPFKLKTAQAFIEHHLQDIKISNQLRNFLTDFTGGHPLYLHLICQEIVSLCGIHRQTEVFMPLLLQALENTIFNPWCVLGRHFDFIINQLCIGKGNRNVAAILLTLANGKHKLKDIMAATGLKKTFLTQKLSHLKEVGLVVKNGLFYHLEDKLLRYWIKYVFEKRMNAVDLKLEKLRREFQEEIKQAYGNFHMVSQEGLSSRIIQLLQCFDNEDLNINGRKYKLPFFRNIVPLKRIEERDHPIEMIKASSSQGAWYIILNSETIGEGELNAFLSESKKFDKKPIRRVIISLSELEPNARLRALQEKIWIWNEDELRALLNIYDRPCITK